MKQLFSAKRLTSGSLLATALLLAPLTLDQLPNVEGHSQVLAKGGNGGNGGGHGGNGGGHGHGNGKGHAKHGDEFVTANQEDGAYSERKGSLNAAHASATARQHAAPHSRVGLIATYEKAVLAEGVSDEEATRIGELLEQLEDPSLSNAERHALQAELAAIVDGLEPGDATDADDIDALAEAALSTLESASNKELDAEDKMIDAVNELLEIEEPNTVVDRVKELND